MNKKLNKLLNKEKTLRKVAIKANLKTKQLSHKEADNGIIQSTA